MPPLIVDLADPDDARFVLALVALWRDGPRSVVALVSALAARAMLRTETERWLEDYVPGAGGEA